MSFANCGPTHRVSPMTHQLLQWSAPDPHSPAGGALVCCGSGHHTSFHDCSFDNCTLYVVHGAAVVLRRCTHRGKLAAVIAHGAATSATLEACTFHDGVQAVIAERSAAITAAQCTSSHMWQFIIAHDVGTHVSCSDCFLGGHTPMSSNVTRGIVATDAHVSLRRCLVDSFVDGVTASGRGAAVELHECQIKATTVGVRAREGATVLLRGSHIHVCKPLRGVRVPIQNASAVRVESESAGGRGGFASVERCSLSTRAPRHDGVVVRADGAATLLLSKVHCLARCVVVPCRGGAAVAHCDVQSGADNGCVVESAGSILRIFGGCVAGGTSAAMCTDGGLLTVQNSALSGIQHAGSGARSVVVARDGGTANLSRCTLRDALWVVEVYKAAVVARDVAVFNSGDFQIGSCGYWHNGGHLAVLGGSIKGCDVGVSVGIDKNAPEVMALQASAASAEFSRVRFDGNVVALFLVGSHKVTAVECVFAGIQEQCAGKADAGNRDDRALFFDKKASRAIIMNDPADQVSIRDSMFVGNERDVMYMGGGSLQIGGCTFLGRRADYKGLSLELFGTGARVEGCTFQEAGHAVVVQGSGCVIKGCRFLGGVDGAVLLMASGVASIADCQFEGCIIAIEAQQGTTVTVTDCKSTGAEVALYVNGAASAEAVRLMSQGGDVGVLVSDGGTVLKLADCAIFGAATIGLHLRHAGSSASVERLDVEECGMGLLVSPGANVRVARSQIRRCHEGATIGWNEGNMARGRVHEGTVARATLEEVVIHQCGAGLTVEVSGCVHGKRVDVMAAQESSYKMRRFAGAEVNVFEECRAWVGRPPSVSACVVQGPEGEYAGVPEEVPGIEVQLEVTEWDRGAAGHAAEVVAAPALLRE